jgi:hypothetical protein
MPKHLQPSDTLSVQLVVTLFLQVSHEGENKIELVRDQAHKNTCIT